MFACAALWVVIAVATGRIIYYRLADRRKARAKKFNDDLAATLRDDFTAARSAYEVEQRSRQRWDDIVDDYRREIAQTMGVPESVVRNENAELARALHPELSRPAKARVVEVRRQPSGAIWIHFDYTNGVIPIAFDVDGALLKYGYRPDELDYIVKAPHEFVGVEP